MHFLLEQQRSNGFSAFDGADIRGIIPLRESVLHEVAQAVLRDGGAGLPAQLRNLRILPQNRITLDLSVNLFLFRAPVTVTARFDPSVGVADGGQMTIHLEGIAAALSPLLRAIAGKLPPGVTLNGDQILIQPKVLMAQQGLDDFVPLLRRVEFSSAPGILYLGFHLHAGSDQ